MAYNIHGQILDKATLWTFSDGQLPNFLDIGRTLDRNFWKLAPLVRITAQGAPWPLGWFTIRFFTFHRILGLF